MRRHLLFGLLLGIAVLCSTGIQAQNTESYESLMRSGNTKFASKDYISAKTYFEMALKQRPKDAEAKKKLDETLVKIQQDSQRQEVFYYHLDAGDALNAQNKYEEALAEYEKALEVFPDDKYTGAQADAIRAILKERKDKQDAYDTAIAPTLPSCSSKSPKTSSLKTICRKNASPRPSAYNHCIMRKSLVSTSSWKKPTTSRFARISTGPSRS